MNLATRGGRTAEKGELPRFRFCHRHCSVPSPGRLPPMWLRPGRLPCRQVIKLGYPRALAGAVEAVASSGGQIMPPLMGAGAFVMVELTGVPYNSIMGAALLPAILYFLTVWSGINAYAQRYSLKAVEQGRPAGKSRGDHHGAIFRGALWRCCWSACSMAVILRNMAACVAILVAFLLLLVDIRFSFSLPRTLPPVTGRLFELRQTDFHHRLDYPLAPALSSGCWGQTGLGG